MGWASATDLVVCVIENAKKYIKDPVDRKSFYKPVIDEFENRDWDTQDEALGYDEVFDELYKERCSDEE
jgi:hypothetical protein